MKRAEFEHTIRAAGAVLGVHEVLVIGSQALHASVLGDLPDEASRSVEADIAALEDVDGRMADLIDGAIGEASMFHETFGYYAEGWCRRRRCCRAAKGSRVLRRAEARWARSRRRAGGASAVYRLG